MEVNHTLEDECQHHNQWTGGAYIFMWFSPIYIERGSSIVSVANTAATAIACVRALGLAAGWLQIQSLSQSQQSRISAIAN